MATYPPMKSSAIGSMELGSVPSPPKKPRSSTSTQSATQSTRRAIEPAQDQAPASAEEEAPDCRQAYHCEQVDCPAVCADERGERRQPRREERRLGGLRHGPDHSGQCPAVTLPVAPAGPCLQDRHADEEHATEADDDAPEPGLGERTFRQGDEDSRCAVEEHGPGSPEQPGQARTEDPAEGLAEHPDEKSPRHGGGAAESRPPTAGGDQEPDPETELNPDGGGRGLNGVIGPNGGAAVHEVLHPSRGARC